jgi:twitching motility protein PilT
LAALRAAETGHLVLSTLHTIDAGQSVNRIIGMFQPEEEREIRMRLSDSLRWVVSQRLLPKIGAGRHAVFEIMRNNLRVQELVLSGETADRTFYQIITDGEGLGMQTFETDLLNAFRQKLITEQTALSYSVHRAVMRQKIDQVKSSRGEKTTDIEDLSLDREYGKY